jgi:hypothetical protein
MLNQKTTLMTTMTLTRSHLPIASLTMTKTLSETSTQT